MASQNVKVVSEEGFTDAIANGGVLVDFYADWCGPCRMLAPVLETVAQELNGQVAVVKLDINNAQSVTSKYDIKSIPTLIFFKDGKEAGRLVGLHNATAIKDFILSK